MAEAYIVGAVRTAGGRRNGRLKDWHPIDLGALVLDELVARTGADPAAIEDVIFGCVDQVGAQSANIARNCSQAADRSCPAAWRSCSKRRACRTHQSFLCSCNCTSSWSLIRDGSAVTAAGVP